jgi:hypothetical protein
MPGFRFEAEVIRLDHKAFSKTAIETLEVQMRNAAREFLRAAIPRVPIDTGMAVGSFLNIGRFLRVAVPRGPGPYSRKHPNWKKPQTYTHFDGTKMPKTPESGASLSTQPEDAFQRNGGEVSFDFRSEVYHYILNDVGIVHGPWQSFSHGRAAFERYTREILPTKLPKVYEFIVKNTISSE